MNFLDFSQDHLARCAISFLLIEQYRVADMIDGPGSEIKREQEARII